MYAHRKIGLLLSCSITIILAAALAGGAAQAQQASPQTQAAVQHGGVQIDIPPDAPVRVINFGFDPSPAGTTAFHYDVQNLSGQGLVAVEIRWQAQSERSSSVVSNRDDRWLTGDLAPGASEHFQVTNVASGVSEPAVVQRGVAAARATSLAASVAYAELEDGSRLGSEWAKVSQEIGNARHAQLAACAKLLDAFGSGGGEALAQALKQGTATGSQDPAAQELTARMLSLLIDQGSDAVVLELQRISALNVPQPRS